MNAKMARASSISMPSVVKIMGRRNSVLFFFVYFLFVMLWNYEDCDNGNATKQCNFQNNYGVVAHKNFL